MKLLLIHDGHEFGGLERVMVETVRALAKRHRIAVIVRGSTYGALRSPEDFVSALRDAGAEVWERDRNARRAVFDILRFVRLIRQIHSVAPDIVHIHTVKVESCHDVVAASRLAGVATVLRTEHNSPSAFSRANYRSLRRRFFDRLTSAFVTVSEHDRVEQVDTVGRHEAKVICIRNGVDVARFAPASNSSLDTQHDRRTAPIVVGTAGRLSDQKGHRYLVEAMALLCERRQDVYARIAGEGTLRGSLETLASALGVADHVDLVGQVAASDAFFAGLDIGVMPSLHEGLSLTLLEMMATSLPTVVSDHPGLTEAAVDGLTSVVVPIGDPVALAEALGELADDREHRRRLGRAARERIEKEFSTDRYFAELDALYDGEIRRADSRGIATVVGTCLVIALALLTSLGWVAFGRSATAEIDLTRRPKR